MNMRRTWPRVKTSILSVDELLQLERILGIQFKNRLYLLNAMIHRSFINEHPDILMVHNERLEFLGDAALELAVTDFLYKQFRDREGTLTAYRASLVNREALCDIADELGLDDYLCVSYGVAINDFDQSKARRQILANALEAVIGAIFLDSGYEVARDFILRVFPRKLEEVLGDEFVIDPKGRLQEICQERYKTTPTYTVDSTKGTDNNRTYIVSAYVGPACLGKGSGTSKKEAEVEAATNALKDLK